MDKTHHLYLVNEDCAGNDGLGRYFLVPGSPARAKLIAELFDEITREVITPRHNDTYLGWVALADGRRLDVGVSSSGMGVGSMEICANELIDCGARRLIRVGTSGAVLDPPLRAGDYVIATGAVRDEMASRHYLPVEFPAVAHPDTVIALGRAAAKLGVADRTFAGVVHSKASLFARAKMVGPLAEEHEKYKRILKGGLVLSSEMEASALFIVAQCRSETVLPVASAGRPSPGVVKAGTLLGIIGTETGWTTSEEQAGIERRTCELAVEGLRQLFLLEQAG